jgi:hypothetical protein
MRSRDVEVVQHSLVIMGQLITQLVQGGFAVASVADAVLGILDCGEEAIVAMSIYVLAVCLVGLQDPSGVLAVVWGVFGGTQASAVHFALNGLIVALEYSERIRVLLLERRIVGVCCEVLGLSPELAEDGLRCLYTIAALGHEAEVVSGGALVAVAQSGIVSGDQDSPELFSLCAEFCARCIAQPSFLTPVLEAQILPHFCQAAQGGIFENRIAAFSVFQAAFWSDELVRVIAEHGGGQAILEGLESGQAEALPLLLRLLAASSALNTTNTARIVAEFTDNPSPQVAALAGEVLRLLYV